MSALINMAPAVSNGSLKGSLSSLNGSWSKEEEEEEVDLVVIVATSVILGLMTLITIVGAYKMFD